MNSPGSVTSAPQSQAEAAHDLRRREQSKHATCLAGSVPPGTPLDPRPTPSDLHVVRCCSASTGGVGPRKWKGDFSFRHHWASGEGSGHGQGRVSPSWMCRGVCSRPPRSHRGGGRGRLCHEGLPDRGERPGGVQTTDRGTLQGEITEHMVSLKLP